MKKFLLSIFAVLFAFAGAQAEEYTYTFSAKQFTANGTKKLNNVNWTLSGDGGYWGYDGTKGQQFGSGSAPYKNMTLSTSGIEGTITKIVINTSGASSVNASFTVSVGGIQYGASTKLTTSATKYTFEGSASGEIKFSYTQTSKKAIYIKSIEITSEVEGQKKTVTTPVIYAESKTFNEGESLTVTIETETEGAEIYYTLDGSDPVENGDLYDGEIELTGTTTVKAVAMLDGWNNSAVAEATFTAIDPNAPTATITFDNKSKRIEYTESKQVWSENGVTFTNDKAKSTTNIGDYFNPVRLYKSSTITISSEREFSRIVFDCNPTSDAAHQENLESSVEGAMAEADKVAVTFEPTTSYTITLTAGQVRLDALTVVYAVEEEAESYTLAVTEAGWATLYLGFPAEIPADVKAYTVTKVNNGYVTLTQVEGVLPANTGIIVKADEDDYNFVASTGATADVTGNLLSGTTKDTVIESAAYVLGIKDGIVGLYTATTNGYAEGTFLNNANKAYLPKSVVPAEAQGAASFSFRFPGTTGIEEVATENVEVKTIYDLTGRRVEAITAPGIYIVNGVKRVVR